MENIKLIQGNCLEELRKMEDNSIDVIITDPPYGILSGSKTIGGSNNAIRVVSIFRKKKQSGKSKTQGGQK